MLLGVGSQGLYLQDSVENKTEEIPGKWKKLQCESRGRKDYFILGSG